MPETVAAKRARALEIIRLLDRAYPEATIALRFSSPLELLVATILAAQCTDERVNQVTESLFRKYRTARDYAAIDPATFEREIRSTGFFRAKTRAIAGMARALLEHHGGGVPRTLEALTALPGVGRKTANVVLGNAFDTPGIAVDTHVFRVSQRLGLAGSDVPDQVEAQLAEVIPRPRWTHFCHLLQAHGRQICLARAPDCPVCPVRLLCPWPGKTVSGRPGRAAPAGRAGSPARTRAARAGRAPRG
ncbi:MAG TPA: endonuclease III [Methylomirabilota bacterium]|nr:endonuclease III [Methylomirabilota bacterium]